MPKAGPRLVKDYLIPNLDKRSFGDRLKWVDTLERIFRIQYTHKNTANWTTEDAAVFTEWDRLKDPGRFQPNESEYYTLARQRLNSAINKFVKEGTLITVPVNAYTSTSTERRAKSKYRYYQIVEGSKSLLKKRKTTKIQRPHKGWSPQIYGPEKSPDVVECFPDVESFSPSSEQLEDSNLDIFQDMGRLVVPVVELFDVPTCQHLPIEPTPSRLDFCMNEVNFVHDHDRELSPYRTNQELETFEMFNSDYDGDSLFQEMENPSSSEDWEEFQTPEEFHYSLIPEGFYQICGQFTGVESHSFGTPARTV